MNHNFITVNRGRFQDFYTLGKFLDISKFISFKPSKGGRTKIAVCKHKVTGVERVVKMFSREQMTTELETKFANEVNILKRLDHPNIIRLYEQFKDDTHYYLIEE